MNTRYLLQVKYFDVKCNGFGESCIKVIHIIIFISLEWILEPKILLGWNELPLFQYLMDFLPRFHDMQPFITLKSHHLPLIFPLCYVSLQLTPSTVIKIYPSITTHNLNSKLFDMEV